MIVKKSSKKIADVQMPPVSFQGMSWRSMKISVKNPTYHTVTSSSFQVYSCFNGCSYTGEAGRNKKENERLAARAVIVSLLESKHKTIISKII
nr:double-stranded RNA-binding protein 4-like [Ipomoea batatas]